MSLLHGGLLQDTVESKLTVSVGTVVRVKDRRLGRSRRGRPRQPRNGRNHRGAIPTRRLHASAPHIRSHELTH